MLLIDEINRGHLNRIFGELLVLLEADKRGPAHALRLPYAPAEAPRFFVPDNLYLIGTMNTADRSLAPLDYALRRRFALQATEPQVLHTVSSVGAAAVAAAQHPVQLDS